MSFFDNVSKGDAFTLNGEGGKTATIKDASSLRFDGRESTYALTDASGFKDYNVAAIVLFILERGQANYLQHASEMDIQIISFADRAALGEVLDKAGYKDGTTKGKKGTALAKKTTSKGADAMDVDAKKSSNGKISGSKIVDSAGGDYEVVKGEIIYKKGTDGYRLYGYQHPLTDRNNILTLEKEDKNLENIAKLARTVLTHARQTNGSILNKVQPDKSSYARPHDSRAGKSSSRPESKSGKQPIPIIIVPSAIQSLITLFNIKQFLVDGTYVPMDTITDTFNKPNRVVIERKLPAGHTGGSKFPKVYHVIDSADHLKSHEWQNVVAAFITGQEWQFKTWRYNDPVKLFDHVRGFNLRYVGDPPAGDVPKWAVRQLLVHRRQRHNDKQAVSIVWEEIDDFITKKKRDVFQL